MTDVFRSSHQQAIFNVANRCQNCSAFSKLGGGLPRSVVRVADDLASQTHGVSRAPQSVAKYIRKYRNCVFSKSDDVNHLGLVRFEDCLTNTKLTILQSFQKVEFVVSFCRATSKFSSKRLSEEQR